MPQRTGRNAESQRNLPRSAAPGSVPDRLREAATQLFSEYGFDGTSVQDIVDAAQLTKGALYYYYTSKSDILHEIYHALIRRQLEGLDRVLTLGLEPAETIRTLLTDLLETTAAFRHESVIFRREMHKLEPQHLKSIAADRRRYHETFLGLIDKGQRDGVFSDKISAEIATYTVFGMINQLCTWYRPDGPKSPRQIADELTDFTLAALRTENSAN
jgi:AcrR family transcriptional regulator